MQPPDPQASLTRMQPKRPGWRALLGCIASGGTRERRAHPCHGSAWKAGGWQGGSSAAASGSSQVPPVEARELPASRLGRAVTPPALQLQPLLPGAPSRPRPLPAPASPDRRLRAACSSGRRASPRGCGASAPLRPSDTAPPWGSPWPPRSDHTPTPPYRTTGDSNKTPCLRSSAAPRPLPGTPLCCVFRVEPNLRVRGPSGRQGSWVRLVNPHPDVC